MRKPIIAIDGPAASGKSTTAQRVAQHFDYRYIDTGAMYRAVTLKVLQEGIDPSDSCAVGDIVDTIDLTIEYCEGKMRIVLDQIDVTDEIRSVQVTRHVSAVSEMKHVREVMVQRQRQMGGDGGVVVEGRDIGTVVFPDAEVKVYLVADVGERSRRRSKELRAQSISADLEGVEQTIQQRDHWDSTRMHSPLRKAEDSQLIDTTSLTIDEQVGIVIRKVERVLQRGGEKDSR